MDDARYAGMACRVRVGMAAATRDFRFWEIQSAPTDFLTPVANIQCRVLGDYNAEPQRMYDETR